MRADGGKVQVDTQVRFLAWGNCWAVVSLQDRIDLQKKELIWEAWMMLIKKHGGHKNGKIKSRRVIGNV